MFVNAPLHRLVAGAFLSGRKTEVGVGEKLSKPCAPS